ncbi:MAG TPA: DUF1844 domain-containing protein [Pyrinomonadaceae bacterium]|jgi:hypothetical protein
MEAQPPGLVESCAFETSTMSEEQTGFKVTDRRLFNPDGTPREVERDDPADQSVGAGSDAHAASSASESRAGESSASASQETPQQQHGGIDAARAATEGEEGEGVGTRSAGRASRAEAHDESHTAERTIPGADDPASFINFLMSIASNAAASLGMMEHPVTGEHGVDLQLAKHWIDVLGMLQERTRGNLAAQEQQIFEGLLSDLRMQYVSLTNTAPPTTKRGFTGRDIIGGK